MDNKVINKEVEIAEIIKIFKPNLELKSSEMNERRLKFLKKCVEKNEKIVNNKDETDTEFINDELNNIESVFECFCSMYNIDYAQSTINDSNFIETPDEIKNRKCTITPQNKAINAFNIQLHFLCFIKKLIVTQTEYQRLNHLLTILVGKFSTTRTSLSTI